MLHDARVLVVRFFDEKAVVLNGPARLLGGGDTHHAEEEHGRDWLHVPGRIAGSEPKAALLVFSPGMTKFYHPDSVLTARYAGSLDGETLSLRITLAESGRQIGPFTARRG